MDEALLLLNAKLFFRGLPDVSISYHDQTFVQWLNDNIYANAIINSDTPM